MPESSSRTKLRGILKSLVRHSIALFSGQFIAVVFGFLAAIIAARHLGPGAFGLVVVVQTYVLIVDRIANFQTWETLIRFGARAEAEGANTEFQDILSYCWQIDVATAVIGTLIAYLLFPWFSDLFGLAGESHKAALFYPLVILFNLTGTSVGFLRLRKKISKLSIAAIVTGVVRFVLASVGVVLDLGVTYFLVAWAIAEMATNLTILMFGYSAIKRHGFAPFRGRSAWATIQSRRGVARFTIISNLHSSTVLACKETDQLVVGALLGLESTGILKIAKQFAALISKPFDPISQIIYPELAKLASRSDFNLFKSLVIKTSIGCGVLGILGWLALFLFGEKALLLTVGAFYLDGYAVLLLYGLGVVFAVSAAAMQSSMVSLGLQETSFYLVLTTSVLYLAMLYFSLTKYGLVGAGVAYGIFMFVQVSGMFLLTFYKLRYLTRGD